MRHCCRVLALLLSSTLIVTGGARADEPDPDSEVTTVQVRTRTPVESLDQSRAPSLAALTGSNNDSFWDGAHGLWDLEADRPNPDLVAKTRAAGITMVRFPGGTPAALYDWRAGIGPAEQRGCQTIGRANGEPGPVDSRFGPDEYMEFIDAIDGTAVIMTPMVNQTADDAANWVEYMNAPVGSNPRGGTAWADVRAAHGHHEPYDVAYWEIGNEPDRGGQSYWRSTDPLESLQQYTFGGSHPQKDQRLARGCDRTADASLGTGGPGQRVQALYPPVMQGSQSVTVDGSAWSAVDDLHEHGPDERVYTFAADTGEVIFGDGVHGRVPPEGARLKISYVNAPKPGFVDFYREMKKADPTIDVLATWAPIRPEQGLGKASFPRLMADHGLADDYDGVVIHPYTSFAVDFGDRDWETAQEGHDEHMLGEAKATDLVRDLIAEVRRHGGDHAYVATTEFGALWFGQNGDISSFPSWNTSLSHGTYMASQWAHFAQLGLPWALGNTLVSEQPQGLRAVFGGQPAFVPTVDAVIREQLKPMTSAGGTTVSTQIHRNPRISPIESVPGFGGYSALVASGAIGEDGRLRIMVVNRQASATVKARVLPAGFPHTGSVEVTQVTGDHVTSFNSIDHPRDVRIATSEVHLDDQAFAYAFPAHSVTLLTLSPHRS